MLLGQKGDWSRQESGRRLKSGHHLSPHSLLTAIFVNIFINNTFNKWNQTWLSIPRAPYDKDCANPIQPRTTEMLGPPNNLWAWITKNFFLAILSWTRLNISYPFLYLSCDSWKLSKSKEVHQPDCYYECGEVKLSNIVDTDQVYSEKYSNQGHKFAVTKLVNKKTRYKSGQAIDNPTEMRTCW